MRRFAPLAVLAATLLHGSLVQAAEPLAIDVHRDANCGCCRTGSSTSKPTVSRSPTMWKQT